METTPISLAQNSCKFSNFKQKRNPDSRGFHCRCSSHPLRRIPPDTACVLIDPENWKRPKIRDRFEYQGLNDVRIQVKDQRFDNGGEYLLIGREPGFVRKRRGE